MPGKITELGAQTGAAAATADLLETVDVSDTSMAATGTNKKLPLADLVTFLNANGITDSSRVLKAGDTMTGALTVNVGAVINETANDADFRVESMAQTHMLFVDASTNRVGVGKSVPTYMLDVNGSGHFLDWVDMDSGARVGGLLDLGGNIAQSPTKDATLGLIKGQGTARFYGKVELDLDPVEVWEAAHKGYVDTKLPLVGGGTLTPGAPQTTPLLKLDSNNTVTVTSTDHPFQVGTTAGLNIRMGRNNIETAFNGVASNLNINPAGGTVEIGDSLICQSLYVQDGATTSEFFGPVSMYGGLYVEGAHPGDTLAINAQTGTAYTLALTDHGKLVTLSNASAITLTIPTNATVSFPTGAVITLAQINTGAVTVGGVGVTINATPSNTLRTRYSSAQLIKTATDTWLLVGDLL